MAPAATTSSRVNWGTVGSWLRAPASPYTRRSGIRWVEAWLPLVREIQGQGKVREFCAGSRKFEILRKVREMQENPLKFREI